MPIKEMVRAALCLTGVVGQSGIPVSQLRQSASFVDLQLFPAGRVIFQSYSLGLLQEREGNEKRHWRLHSACMHLFLTYPYLTWGEGGYIALHSTPPYRHEPEKVKGIVLFFLTFLTVKNQPTIKSFPLPVCLSLILL